MVPHRAQVPKWHPNEEIEQWGLDSASDFVVEIDKSTMLGKRYNSSECFGGDNLCLECCLDCHHAQPLHVVEKWNGLFFEKTSLMTMGMRVQLGHGSGKCSNPMPAPKSFTVLHTNGIHLVAVDYFLRASWYSATVHYPATCATLQLLKHFHGLSLCSKVSAHEYYLNMERMTDNARVVLPKYRHIKMMKRAGRGNVEGGIEATGMGDLAIQCLASNWRSSEPALRHVNHDMLTEHPTPGLHTGHAYFVPQDSYNEHILKHVSQADISSCSGFSALSHADSKSNTGLRYMGVGMWVGNLQKGEQYCNMDFIVLSAVSGTPVQLLMVIYDIACQWKVNFTKRMVELPPHLHIPSSVTLDFAILKCHCPAHQTECQTPHSLNLKPGAGQMDSEGIKRDWSMINPAANSTKEMAPGTQHNTLDDLFGYHNWQKTVGLGESLRRKYFLAVVESRRHRALHEEYSETIGNDITSKWTQMVVEWEADKTKPNPYISANNYQSEHIIKLRLVEEEQQEEQLSLTDRMETMVGFLTSALVLEESQRRITQEALGKDLTPLQASQLQECRLNLTKQIKRLRISQRMYMPIVETLIANTALQRGQHGVEQVELWLPSALDTRVRSSFDRLDSKINQAVQKYRAAHTALRRLHTDSEWCASLPTLRNQDICPPPAFDIDNSGGVRSMKEAATRLGEGHCELSWIWRTATISSDGEDALLNEGLRIEWVKSRARYLQWSEEVLLCKEEMRHVRQALQSHIDNWTDKVMVGSDVTDDTMRQGLSAYAQSQIGVFRSLHTQFTTLWETPPRRRSQLPALTPPAEDDSTIDESLMLELLRGAAEAGEVEGDKGEDDDEDDEEG
ncbi:hypothetical protein BDN71DRAFT_1479795 [Pleurotus eryngii]|uniref:CxC2-like cysteine cluster KDZ transposase-associated domain-containing protein n=1 Tax=Pleurotus eryngii TaxID=5323 RepID=A0A9P6DKW4_PLEER|nr:hypothetical protein BDN71DRAFT_1479795 [Pleurotus eryngii]